MPAVKIKDNNAFRIVYFILVILFLIRFLPYLYPDGRFWGFNHLIFLPNTFAIIYAIIAVLALTAPFFKSTSRMSEAFIENFSRIFFKSKYKYLYRLIFIAIMGGLFIIFAAPTHFLGDGYLQIANLASKTGMIHKWSEKGITLLVDTVQGFLGEKGEQTAITAFQILSFLAGLISINFYFLIADTLTENKGLRVLTFCVLLFSGALLLFFGYIESYPLLIACYSAFIYFGLKYYKKGKGIIFSLVALIVGIALHLQLIMAVPAILFLLLSRGIGLALYKKIRIPFWIGLAFFTIFFVVIFSYYYSNYIFVENIFLPPFIGKPMTPSYAIFSFSHIYDIINQLMLLSPLLPILLLAHLSHIRYNLRNPILVFLLLNSIAVLFFLLVIDPQLSMPRDWDLFSLCGFAPGLFLLALLDNKTSIVSRRLVLPLVLFLIGSSIPYLITNLDEKSSIKFVEHFINHDLYKNRVTYLNLKNYYQDMGNIIKADSLNALYTEYYPYAKDYGLVFSAIKQGDIDRAKEIAQSLPNDRFSKDYHNMWTTLYYLDGDYQKALESSKKAIQLDKYSAQSYVYLGMVYNKLDHPDSALNAFRVGYHLNLTNKSILIEMISLFQNIEMYDSTVFFSRKLLEVESTHSNAFYFLTLAYLSKNQPDSALKYYNSYQRLGRRDAFFDNKSAELRRLMNNP